MLIKAASVDENDDTAESGANTSSTWMDRSLMIGAVEKSKSVYILNRDASAKLIISSR